MTKHIFVYGTLKQGMGASDLMRGTTFKGKAMIPAKMYHLGGFPGIKLDPQSTTYGEVYELPADPKQADIVVSRLDGYEGVPHLYSRVESIATGEDNETRLPVYVYEINRQMDERRFVKSGVW